jgi:sugar lactone lactonase YvrE
MGCRSEQFSRRLKEMKISKVYLLAGAFTFLLLALAGFECIRIARAADPPELRRMNPDTVTAGAPTFTLRCIGRNFVAGSRIVVDGAPLTSRVNENGRILLAEIDSSVVASAGSHTVQALNPDDTTSETLSFTVVTPDTEVRAQLRGNAIEEDFNQNFLVEINGEGFDNRSTVIIWGSEAPETEFVSETTLLAEVPLEVVADPARIPVMVRNRGDRFSNVDIFFVVPRPASLEELDPFEIEVGTEPFELRVFGSNFKDDARVVVNGVPLETTHPRAGRLDTMVPAELRSAPGQLVVRVEQEGIQSSDFTLTVTPTDMPFIYTVAPVLLRVGETRPNLDLVGANFRGAVAAMIDGQEATIRNSTRRRITIRVPAEILSTPGTHTVQIKGTDESLSNVTTFNVVPDVMVNTLAGRKLDGFNLDQLCVPNEEALFRRPSRITIGPDGLLYVADQQNHAIRSIDPASGEVCTVAGTGEFGYNDSGNPRNFPPTFSNPLGVAVTEDGAILVSENGNNVVRRILRNGSGVSVDTFAGVRTEITNPEDQDRRNSTLRGLNGFRNGEPTEASFRQPDDIVIAPDGTIYISDAGNHSIRRVRSVGGQIMVDTVAGNGVPGFVDGDAVNARFRTPTGLALSPDGQTLFVADLGNNRIRRVNLVTLKVDTLSGSGNLGSADGPPAEATFSQPIGVAVDVDGTVYVSEFNGARIRRVDPAGNATTLAGIAKRKFRDGPGLTAAFRNLRGLAIDRTTGVLYIADYENSRIRGIPLR